MKMPVLFVGHGNPMNAIEHNVFHAAWAQQCDDELRQHIAAGQIDALIDYPDRDAGTRRAVPTVEHYLPLLYALALQQAGETAEMFNTRVVSSISMTSVLIGVPPQA